MLRTARSPMIEATVLREEAQIFMSSFHNHECRDTCASGTELGGTRLAKMTGASPELRLF